VNPQDVLGKKFTVQMRAYDRAGQRELLREARLPTLRSLSEGPWAAGPSHEPRMRGGDPAQAIPRAIGTGVSAS
jgi:hypothetical protein